MSGPNRKTILLALFAGLSIFMAYNLISLSYYDGHSHAAVIGSDDYRWGTTDANIAQMKADISEIKKSIKEICADVTKVQVQAARDGALYGGGGGIGIYLLGLLAQALKKKK